MKGKYEKLKSEKGGLRKVALFFIIGILLLIVGTAVAVAVYYRSMLGKIQHVDVPDIVYTTPEIETTDATKETDVAMPETTVQPKEAHIPSSEDYINFLLVGQASREGEAERFADTMILCTVNTYDKTLTMTSLLRDTLVKMPDYKKRIGGNIKLTTIYHLGSTYGDGVSGSMELMNQTLYDNFGIEVDHNFEVDFDAFIRVIDMLGGIDIELTEAEADYLNADDFWVYEDVQPGMAHLDGMTALCYARMRKAAGDEGSDITRTSRQRKVIANILEKIKGLSIGDIQSLVDEVLPLITTSMDSSEITKMLMTLLPILPDLRIEASGTCPANYWGDMVEIYHDGVYHSVLRFDKGETKTAMRRITKGETN